MKLYIGCAGWSIPRPYAGSFPLHGTHLERYARTFSAVEINSSFYRHHKPETYRRWASVVPHDFRFSVKMPRTVTHDQALVGAEPILDRFCAEISELETKLGPVLVQLPPSLAFDKAEAERFFEALRDRFTGKVVLEPRHPSWFASDVDHMLESFRVGRVAADPAVVPEAAHPSGSQLVTYYRLHGSPQMYYSPYGEDMLDKLSAELRQSLSVQGETWCIFDNTTVGYATDNALYVLRTLAPEDRSRTPAH